MTNDVATSKHVSYHDRRPSAMDNQPSDSAGPPTLPPRLSGNIDRHGIALHAKLRPLSDFPKEVRYMRARRKAIKVLNASAIYQHRIELLEDLPPIDDSELTDTDDTGLFERIDAQAQEAARTSAEWGRDGQTDADILGRRLELEAQGRACPELIQVQPPQSGQGMSRVQELQRLVRMGSQQEALSGTSGATSLRHPVVTLMADLIDAVRIGHEESVAEKKLARLLNAVASTLSGTMPEEADGTAWTSGLRGAGKALFFSQGPNSPRDHRVGAPLQDRPVVVGLLHQGEIPEGNVAQTSDIATWIALSPTVSSDLGTSVFRHALWHEKCKVIANAVVGRSYGLTLCGPVLRLWCFDASGFTTSRAIDVRDPSDIPELTMILTFLTGPTEELVQRWRPQLGDDLYCLAPAAEALQADAPDGQGASAAEASSQAAQGLTQSDASTTTKRLACYRVQTTQPFKQLNDVAATPIFGRRTAVWGGIADSIEAGFLENGRFRRNVSVSPRHNVDIVIKTSWLPAYLIKHEHIILERLRRSKVKNVPQSLGLLQLPTASEMPWHTLQRRQHSLIDASPFDEDALSLVPRDAQLYFTAMVMESQVGITLPREITPFGMRSRVAALCATFKILLAVSAAGVHYRDINFGNVLLKPDWEALLQRGQQDIVILVDFGNARILNVHRGYQNHPLAQRLPLGLDDILSVNKLFQTTNAIESLQKRKSLRTLMRRPASKAVVASIARVQADFALLDYRYIDDIESTLYCYLYQLRLCPAANRTWAKRLDELVRDQKRYLWEDLGWDAEVCQPSEQRGQLLTEGLSVVLAQIHQDVLKAQLEIRAEGNKHLRTPEMNSLEGATYCRSIQALEAWLTATASESTSMSLGVPLRSQRRKRSPSPSDDVPSGPLRSRRKTSPEAGQSAD